MKEREDERLDRKKEISSFESCIEREDEGLLEVAVDLEEDENTEQRADETEQYLKYCHYPIKTS